MINIDDLHSMFLFFQELSQNTHKSSQHISTILTVHLEYACVCIYKQISVLVRNHRRAASSCNYLICVNSSHAINTQTRGITSANTQAQTHPHAGVDIFVLIQRTCRLTYTRTYPLAYNFAHTQQHTHMCVYIHVHSHTCC